MKTQKLLKVLGLALLGSLSYAGAEEAAADYRWYVAGSGNAGFMSKNRYTHNSIDDRGTTNENRYTMNPKFKSGFGGAVAFGCKADEWRLEVEGFASKHKMKSPVSGKVLSGTTTQFNAGSGYTTADTTATNGTVTSSHVNVMSVMLNAYYDFNLMENLDWYVGAGVGVARVETKIVETFSEGTYAVGTTGAGGGAYDPAANNSTNANAYNASLDHKFKKSVFAGQIKTGLIYHFNDMFSVFAGYRLFMAAKTNKAYTNTSTFGYYPAVGAVVNNTNTNTAKALTKAVISHNVEFGFRATF